MNALTTTTTFCPSSFQLKLALGSRKYPLAFVRTRFPELDRRRVNFVSMVVRNSDVNGNGLERRGSGNSSWANLNSSADGFSGWANADAEGQSGDSKPKKSLLGILGTGAAGVLLVAGLIFAALSMSKRGTSGVKKEMVPLTTQQEKSLSSDDNPNQVEEQKNGEEVGMLESSSEESKTGTNRDPSLYIENSEAIESRISDDTSVRQSSEDGDGYIPKAVQRETAIGDSSVSLEATDKPPTSDITGGSLALPSIQSNDGSIPSENPGEPAAEKLGDTKILEKSVFDANPENIVTDHPNVVSSLNELENSNLSLNPSSVEPSVLKMSDKSELDAVMESSVIDEEFVESRSVLSTSDVQGSKELLTVDVGPSKLLEVSVDGDDQSPTGGNPNGTASTGAPLVPEVAYQSANEHLENDYNDISVSQSFIDSKNPGNFFTSAGIPAPSVVSAALQPPPGKVLVPAVIDQLQSQALSALQVLKVIEDDVQPGDLCTRREYARWLVLASSALSRNTTSKVYPAMYIENVSELAFDDITPEDPDFPSIQGLAEAGLIASKLSRRDMQSHGDEDPSPIYFSPESPISRQDLIALKPAFCCNLDLAAVFGFIDIDKIHPDAWPALVADLAAGEQGIITLAFGYTRLFQPEKPVTKAQAAIALSTGDASAIVSEELARIEAESMAEKAVTAHSVLVAQVEKDLNASKKRSGEIKVCEEEESLSLMKERAAVDSEMEVLSKLRREVEEQLQTLMSDKLEISYEKERMNKLRRDAETENQEITRLQYELEVERKALSMARAWAEDEAKRAREQAKALDEARGRWEKQGLKVIVVMTYVRKLKLESHGLLLKSNSQSKKPSNVELKNAAKSRLDDSLQGAKYNSAGLTSAVKESAKRVAGDWKEGVERLSQKFKA
ncbi:hypothetical protein DH2020_048596 [Rehmannia glutinosa]|uniref:SLH domain-containing protein n=1 Tax=Rehmannia glutinosa TaxID=99300 RepID=A0ABR0U589_REHGL